MHPSRRAARATDAAALAAGLAGSRYRLLLPTATHVAFLVAVTTVAVVSTASAAVISRLRA